DAALQFVDLVVGAVLHVDTGLVATGGAVPHFQHDPLRSGQDVGVPQVVQAAAGPVELAVPQRALRLRTEQLQLRAGFAERGGPARAPSERGAVQRTLVLRVFGDGDAGGELAPQRLA